MNRPDVKIYANTLDFEESRVAIVEDGRLRELFIEHPWERQRGGEIYKARVDSVLPGMHAAFVDLGDGRNGFLYLNDAPGLEVRKDAELLVQVVKTPRKNKGPRVTTRLSLPGRSLVLLPGENDVGVSRKIGSDQERKRLRAIAESLPRDDCGVILRTAACEATLDALEADLEELKGLWKDIEYQATQQKAPCLLYRDLGLVGRVLREELSNDVSEVVVDSLEEYEAVQDFLKRFHRGPMPSVEVHRGATPLFEFYDIEKEIDSLLMPKVWLPSGAYLVIDHTEALTVIDVNTGKYTGASTLRETVLATNLEAADEIMWQLRLRSIGGIVVVDFIDMVYGEDKQAVVQRLSQELRKDRCKTRVFGISALGLLEMTRKRGRADLRTLLTRPCPCCTFQGRVRKEDSVAVALKRLVRKALKSSSAEAILVAVHPQIGDFVNALYLKSWEETLKARILLRPLPEMEWNRFRVEAVGSLHRVEKQAALSWNWEASRGVYRTTETE